MIAWVSRHGGVVMQATRDLTVKTVQKAADLAMQRGRRLCTDSASSYRALTGYLHAYGNHTQKAYARGDVHEHRAECLFALLKPSVRVFRGLSKTNLPGYVGFFQCLRNFSQLTACEQAEMILYAALDPAIASQARKSRTLKVRGGIISQANKYLGSFCSSQRIFPPQIIQVLLKGDFVRCLGHFDLLQSPIH